MIRVFFIPYAGGSASTFSYWKKFVTEKCELIIIDLPGHGKNVLDEPCRDGESACEFLYSFIKSYQMDSEAPYYILGHCLGAVLGYSLAAMISQRREFRMPKNLICSGHNAPDDPDGVGRWHELTDDELIQELLATKMFPEELLHGDFTDVILPIVKADSMLYHDTVKKVEKKPLNVKITVINGTEDLSVSDEKLNRWTEFSKKGVNFITYPGGHYFIEDKNNNYISYINSLIEQDNARIAEGCMM